MRIVCFIDLDDTFLSTKAKCPEGAVLAPAAVDKSGRVISFMTSKQNHLLRALGEIAEIVPTTGRNLDALARVRLSFTSFAITNHGAVITGPNGEIHRPWADTVYPALRLRQAQLDLAASRVEEWSGSLGVAARVRVIHEHEVPTYVSAKCESGQAMARLTERIDLRELGPGLRMHLNGGNLALLPAETSKRRAVAHVIETLRVQTGSELLTLGFGDSLSDAPFLAECDFASTPRESQIAQALQRITGDDLWV